MGWIDSLRGKIVGLDTTPLIYFIEENPAYTATFAQASFFLTNDKRLPSLPGLQTLVLNDLMKEVSDDQQKDS